ncbi:MAG: SpoIIE family protein phosphatase [Acidimicrobiaceae bacterium]|nr:SpoIIE family protein phosphatase [Acidimicrobiaceae bacterium]
MSLNRLRVDDLLGELLERVRAILEADTAAVLLLDRGANELVARAARGLEEEVHQGARVPFGEGFAGYVARLRQPVAIEKVDPTTTANPILWAKGLRSMLGVPLLADEQVLGVLHVGRLDGRRLMGQVRSALRGSALLGREPDQVLSLADGHLQRFEPGTMVTALCAVAAPPYDTFRISSAGHPPPVLAVPGSRSRFVELNADLPLNARSDAPRASVTLTVAPGGLLLCYTDGLVERRDERLEARLEELRDVVTAEDPERVCQRVMGRMVGLERPIDDIALLALRRQPQTAHAQEVASRA